MSGFVEKLRVRVRVAIAGGEPFDGLVSVSTHARLHSGPETLLERLNTPTRVVPIECDGQAGVVLACREQIAWIEAGADVDDALVRPITWQATREEQARIRLWGGGEVEGVLVMEMPAEFNRASDFLNGDDDFFAVRTNASTLLVNKRQVAEVRVFTALPASRQRAA